MANAPLIYYHNLLYNPGLDSGGDQITMTVTGSNIVDGFQVEYTYDKLPNTFCRLDATGGENITMTMPAGKGADRDCWGIFIINSDIKATDTVEFHGSNDGFSTTPLNVPVAKFPGNNSHYISPTAMTYDAYRLYISVARDVEIGQIFLVGEKHQLLINYDRRRLKETPRRKRVVTESITGQRANTNLGIAYDFTVPFTLQSQDQKTAIEEIENTTSGYCMIDMLTYDDLALMDYGWIELSPSNETGLAAANRWDSSYEFRISNKIIR